MEVVILTVFAAIAVVSSVQFYRGVSPQSRKWLRNYRNPRLPAIYRNLPIVTPMVALAFVPILVIALIVRIDVHLDVPDHLAAAGGLALVAVMLGLGGLSAISSVRPPAWLIPGWLRDEDRQIGYVPPRMDWFDVATLGFGILLLLVAAGMAVLAMARLFRQDAP